VKLLRPAHLHLQRQETGFASFGRLLRWLTYTYVRAHNATFILLACSLKAAHGRSKRASNCRRPLHVQGDAGHPG
jgi:hypothetical protein